jgi:hypothetical protein
MVVVFGLCLNLCACSTASVRAITFCDVMILSKEAFDSVLAHFPEVEQVSCLSFSLFVALSSLTDSVLVFVGDSLCVCKRTSAVSTCICSARQLSPAKHCTKPDSQPPPPLPPPPPPPPPLPRPLQPTPPLLVPPLTSARLWPKSKKSLRPCLRRPLRRRAAPAPALALCPPACRVPKNF